MFIFELTSLNYCKAQWFNLFYDQKLIDVSLPRNSKMERWNIKKHYFIKHSTILHFYIDILSCFKRNAFNLKCTSFRQNLLIMFRIQFYQQVHFRRAMHFLVLSDYWSAFIAMTWPICSKWNIVIHLLHNEGLKHLWLMRYFQPKYHVITCNSKSW